MTTPRRPRRRPLVLFAASLALAAPLLLSGCSLLHLPGSDGGGVSIPGVGSVGTGKLPGDFPKKDVPIIDGDILTGASIGTGDDQAWNVSVKVSGVDDFTKISSLLTDAGYTAQDGFGGTTDDHADGGFDNGTYQVVVIVSKADGTTVVADYTVTKDAGSGGDDNG